MIRASCLLLALMVLAPSASSASATNVRLDPWQRYQWPLTDDRDCRTGLGILDAWRRLGWPAHAPGDDRRVRVAVVDTGLNPGISDCRGQSPARALQRVRSEFRDDPIRSVGFVHGEIVPGGLDCQGHGTALAGIIGATAGNGEGMAGLVWPIEMLTCQAAPGGVAESRRIAACLDWIGNLADDGVRIPVVNLSLQDTRGDAGVERALRDLRQRGVLVVAAAGNELGVDNDRALDGRSYPASYTISNLISVAGVDRNGALYMSRHGRHSVLVAAPGRDVPAVDPLSNEMRAMHGTSPAAAYVTGLVALLVAQDPSRDWRALRNLVLSGGVPFDSLRSTTVTGRRICASAEGGVGSMTCRAQRIVRRIGPVEDAVVTSFANPVLLRVLSIDCASSVDPGLLRVTNQATGASATVSGLLRDDGGGVDEVAGDGEWTGTWLPEQPGRYELRFQGEPDDRLQVEVHAGVGEHAGRSHQAVESRFRQCSEPMLANTKYETRAESATAFDPLSRSNRAAPWQ